MQVEVAHIGSNKCRIRPPYLSVHIRTVHIDITAIGMDSINHLTDRLLEDTMRRRIRDHTAGKHLFVLLGFRFPVRQIGISQLVTLDYARRETGLHTRCGIRTVSRSRNEKHFALGLTLTFQILADNHQTCIFACGS